MPSEFEFSRRQFLAGLSTATVGFAGCTEGILSTRREWRFDTEGHPFTAPTLDGDTLYAGCNNGILYAFRTSDGTVKWKYEFSESVFSPFVPLANGIVYLGDLTENVHAVDAETGDVRWRTRVGPIVGPILVVEDVVYAASPANGVFALDAETGDVLNEFSIENVGTLSIANRTIYVSHGESVSALNLDTGSQKWQFDTESRIDAQGTTIADGRLYVGNNDGVVYALDAETGEPHWQVTTGDSVYASPTVVSDTVYIGSSDRSLYALDVEDGIRKWRFNAEGAVNGAVSVADEVVYAADQYKYFYALDATTGDERWRFELGAPTIRKPTIGPEHVYVGTGGSVQALQR